MEIFLYNCHISPYEGGNRNNHDPERTRKLLLTKKEILKILGKIKQENYTIVPLELFWKEVLQNLKSGFAKVKKLHDKRETLKRKIYKGKWNGLNRILYLAG